MAKQHRTRSASPLRDPEKYGRSALEVPCPTCHARPRVQCRNYKGRTCSPHATRLAALARWMAVEDRGGGSWKKIAPPAEQLSLFDQAGEG